MFIEYGVWGQNVVGKSKLPILERRNDWLAFNCVQKIVLVRTRFSLLIRKDNLRCLGTLQYMSPDVVLVPPMGYGPEVSSFEWIHWNWSLRFRWIFGVWDVRWSKWQRAKCRSIKVNILLLYRQMQGIFFFHRSVVNTSTLLLKLGNERQAPEIPSELSDIAKDFLEK